MTRRKKRTKKLSKRRRKKPSKRRVTKKRVTKRRKRYISKGRHGGWVSRPKRRKNTASNRRYIDPWNPRGLKGQAAADAQLAWSRSKGNYSVSDIKVVDGYWYRKYGKDKYWSNGLGGELEYRNGKMYYVHSGEMDTPSNYSSYVD